MSLLPDPVKPEPKAKRSKKKTNKDERIILESTVEPTPGWTVSFVYFQNPTKKTKYNTDGLFVRFTGGINWQPDRSIGTAQAYAAVVDLLARSNK